MIRRVVTLIAIAALTVALTVAPARAAGEISAPAQPNPSCWYGYCP